RLGDLLAVAQPLVGDLHALERPRPLGHLELLAYPLGARDLRLLLHLRRITLGHLRRRRRHTHPVGTPRRARRNPHRQPPAPISSLEHVRRPRRPHHRLTITQPLIRQPHRRHRPRTPTHRQLPPHLRRTRDARVGGRDGCR